MKKCGQAQSLDAGEHGLEQWIIKVTGVDICAHVDASDARQFGCAIEFVQCLGRIEHRQRCEDYKLVRMLLVDV
jgi:hypothetical protein